MTATATASAPLVDRIVDRLRVLDLDGLAELYRPDAVFEANVPYWRYQLQGRAAILETLREELADVDEPRVTAWRATTTADGLVVELEVRFSQDGEDRLWREVHVFHTDGGAITEHIDYCTGIWDAATIARQTEDAPMVHR